MTLEQPSSDDDRGYRPDDGSDDATRASLILRVRDPDDTEAWIEFERRYRPIVWRMAVAQGLQNADAEDLVQTVMMKIASAIESFEPNPERARFRTWLKTIARNAIINALSRPGHFRAVGGEVGELGLQNIAVQDERTRTLEWDYRREIFREAANEIRSEFDDSVWRCFWMTAVEQQAAESVADQLGRTIGSVYTARSRVLKRLREVVARMDCQADGMLAKQSSDGRGGKQS